VGDRPHCPKLWPARQQNKCVVPAGPERRDVIPACSKQSPRLFTGECLSLTARPLAASGLTESALIRPVSETVLRVDRNDPAGAPTEGGTMPVPMSGRRPNFLDVIAHGRRTYAVDVPAPHTAEPIDSCDPISRLDWQARAACRGMGSDLLFPPSGNALGLATRICARCPVLALIHRKASVDRLWGTEPSRMGRSCRRGV
jgi:hypothetical protein